MQQKTSKVQSEKNIGIYLDVPIQLAKKQNKRLIRRHRRLVEKRELLQVIREDLNPLPILNSVCTCCYEEQSIEHTGLCKGCLDVNKENEGLDYLYEQWGGGTNEIPLNRDITVILK